MSSILISNTLNNTILCNVTLPRAGIEPTTQKLQFCALPFKLSRRNYQYFFSKDSRYFIQWRGKYVIKYKSIYLEIAGLEPAPSLNATEVYLPIIPYPLFYFIFLVHFSWSVLCLFLIYYISYNINVEHL